MIPLELKELILKYCQGITPTPQQENEINDKVFELGADPMEVIAFIEEAKQMKSRVQLEEEERERQLRIEEAKAKAEEDAKNAQLAADKARAAMAEAEAARMKAEEEKAKTAFEIHKHEVKTERKKTNKTIAIVAIAIVLGIGWFFLRTFTRKSVVDIASDAVYNSVSHTSVRDMDVDTSDIPSDDPSVQVDSKGDVKAQLENFYEKVFDFSDGFYKIKMGNKLGIADKNGKVIQCPKYDKIYGRNAKGLIKIMNGKMIGYLNIKGVEIIEPVYTSISEEKDGLFFVEKDRKYGVINAKTMQLVAPCIYDHIFDKADNRYKVTQGTKMGYLDASGILIEELK